MAAVDSKRLPDLYSEIRIFETRTKADICLFQRGPRYQECSDALFPVIRFRHCRAASTDVFLRYFKTIDLPSVLRLLEARLTLLMPVNHEADSIDQIQRVVEDLDGKASFVVIRNQVHGESFTLYDRSAVRVRLLKTLGGKEITMTRMEEWLVEGLNRENLTVTSAPKHESFYLLDRQRLLTWRRKLYAEIESVAGLLLPGKHATALAKR